MSADAVSVVIVTHNSAEHAVETLSRLTPQLRDGDELMVVDNDSRDGTPDAVRAAAPGARVIETGANLGFPAACNAGADATATPLLLFLNPDAQPAPDCLDRLRDVARLWPRWGCWQALVTLPGGEVVNTSGGIVHFLGMGWSGRWGDSVATVPPAPREVGFASGAALCVRREAWEHTGGFDPGYFLYGEDLDLSLRIRLAGYGVGVAPAARVEHDYEFDKGTHKWFLLERNRWRTLIADYPGRLLALLAPALLLFEIALLPAAARGGWLRQKLRAQAAVARSLPELIARRRRVQALAAVTPGEFARALTSDLDSPVFGDLTRARPLLALQALYWRLVLKCTSG